MKTKFCTIIAITLIIYCANFYKHIRIDKFTINFLQKNAPLLKSHLKKYIWNFILNTILRKFVPKNIHNYKDFFFI